MQSSKINSTLVDIHKVYSKLNLRYREIAAGINLRGGKTGKVVTPTGDFEKQDQYNELVNIQDELEILKSKLAHNLRNVKGSKPALQALINLSKAVGKAADDITQEIGQDAKKIFPTKWLKIIDDIFAQLKKNLKGRYNKANITYSTGKIGEVVHCVAYLEFKGLQELGTKNPLILQVGSPKNATPFVHDSYIIVLTGLYEDGKFRTYINTHPTAVKKTVGTYSLGQKFNGVDDGINVIQIQTTSDGITREIELDQNLPKSIDLPEVEKTTKVKGMLHVVLKNSVVSAGQVTQVSSNIIIYLNNFFKKNGLKLTPTVSKPMMINGKWNINVTARRVGSVGTRPSLGPAQVTKMRQILDIPEDDHQIIHKIQRVIRGED